MADTPLRALALWLLGAAQRISPPHIRLWGKAMLSELPYVEGSWRAFAWAFGGATVLAKHALLSWLVPGQSSQPSPLGGGIFVKEGSMRKAASVGGALCVVVALLFFFAPAFRQALGVSFAGWESFFSVSPNDPQSSLRNLAKQAEKERDAKALAFVAVRLADAKESARLADEAVQLDPKLTWVYAIVASRHADLPQIGRWVERLEDWDPGNALPHLLAAEYIAVVHTIRHDLAWKQTEDPAWNEEMAAAFKAEKLDDYLETEAAVDREVVQRRHFSQPIPVLEGLEGPHWPTYTSWFSFQYSESRLKLAQDLEAKGDLKRASEGYYSVARFGQLLEFQGPSAGFGAGIQASAYKQLQSLSVKAGNYDQATIFSYLAQQSLERNRGSHATPWMAFSRGNAWTVQSSGLLVLAFGAVILVSGLYAGVRRWLPTARQTGGSPGMMVAGLVSAIGFCVSCITLFVSYRPYAEIFNTFVTYGFVPQEESLWLFLGLVEPPYLLWGSWQSRLAALHYFWTAVTILCILGLVLLIVRGVVSHLRAATPA